LRSRNSSARVLEIVAVIRGVSSDCLQLVARLGAGHFEEDLFQGSFHTADLVHCTSPATSGGPARARGPA